MRRSARVISLWSCIAVSRWSGGKASQLDELASTSLPVVCIPGSVEFMSFVLPSVRVALYTANVDKTIHMLPEPGVRHVFVGHGDSDKTASFNPFSRVYSEVWVAGEAGRDRYRRAAVGVRDEDIVEVGRPQLDGISVVLDRIGRRELTVLYAPSCEGWTGDPTHTSLIRTGPALMERLVSIGGFRVIYKPHPFTGTESQEAVAADARVRAAISRAGGRNVAVGGGTPGVAAAGEPTLYDCFNDADLMVADISSVLTDFVYSGKPYVLTNLAGLDDEKFRRGFPVRVRRTCSIPPPSGLARSSTWCAIPIRSRPAGSSSSATCSAPTPLTP